MEQVVIGHRQQNIMDGRVAEALIYLHAVKHSTGDDASYALADMPGIIIHETRGTFACNTTDTLVPSHHILSDKAKGKIALTDRAPADFTIVPHDGKSILDVVAEAMEHVHGNDFEPTRKGPGFKAGKPK